SNEQIIATSSFRPLRRKAETISGSSTKADDTLAGFSFPAWRRSLLYFHCKCNRFQGHSQLVPTCVAEFGGDWDASYPGLYLSCGTERIPGNATLEKMRGRSCSISGKAASFCRQEDRKSTRLNSSHVKMSYA